MSDIRQPTEKHKENLTRLNPIFNTMAFWTNMSNLEDDSKAQAYLMDCATMSMQKAGMTAFNETDLRNAHVKIVSKWDDYRRSILRQVRNGHEAPRLDEVVTNDIDWGRTNSVAEWLTAFLRVNKAIPQCVVSIARTFEDDSKLVDTAKPRQSVLKLLSEVFNKDDNGFRGLQCTSRITTEYRDLDNTWIRHGNQVTGYAHYIGKPSFRHGGNRDMLPERVFIRAPTTPTGTHKDNNVHVYYQESGSGKTVELAASAYTRNALFTIILNTDDVKLLAPSSGLDVKTDRMNKSWMKLTNQVNSFLMQDRKSFNRLVDFLGLLDRKIEEQTTLFIVVAIDEASRSPNFVRAIIESHKDFGKMLGKFIQYKCTKELMEKDKPLPPGATQSSWYGRKQSLSFQESENMLKILEEGKYSHRFNHIDIEVLFSVAGIGVSQVIAGSALPNFIHLQPSAKTNPGQVYDTLRCEFARDDTNTIIPKYTELRQFPLLKAIVDSNARMISIYMLESAYQQDINEREGKKSSENAYEQNAILSRTFNRFMTSNGMDCLLCEPHHARLAASQALSVVLFQQDQPFGQPLNDDQLKNMDYGITFQHFRNDEGGSVMRRLVFEYGLVTAKPFTGANGRTPQASPFELSDAMQLLCLWLIQGGPAVPAEKSFLGTTSASFETLTALLVGAAIAASSVVKKDEDGRVLAAPTEGYDHGTVVQQEADIIAALSKVGMRTKACMSDNNQVSHYTCETTSGVKPVAKSAGDLFWSLKDAHPALLSIDFEIPPVYFHKSTLTFVEEEVDVARIEAAADGAAEAEFHKLNKAHFDQNGTLQTTPLADVGSKKIKKELASHYAMFVDEDLLHILSEIRKLETQSSDMHDFNPRLIKSDGTTRFVNYAGIFEGVDKIFYLPLIHVADDSSELADAYVTFLAESPTTEVGGKRYSVRSICIQSRDLAQDTRPNKKDYLERALAVASPALDPLFGRDRVYTVAGTQGTVPWDNEGRNFPYIPFAVDKSSILKTPMEALSKRRGPTAKHGQHAVLSVGPRKKTSKTEKELGYIDRLKQEKEDQDDG